MACLYDVILYLRISTRSNEKKIVKIYYIPKGWLWTLRVERYC